MNKLVQISYCSTFSNFSKVRLFSSCLLIIFKTNVIFKLYIYSWYYYLIFFPHRCIYAEWLWANMTSDPSWLSISHIKYPNSDAKCGKIQCHSAAKKPKGTNAVSIDTTIRTDGIEVKCRGTYVYSTQDGQGDLPDPGLVMTGTKCGEGKARYI